MKISKWLSLLMAVTMLPLNALAVTEGVVEQAPDVNLSTYTEWAAQSADAYLPDAAMYADLMPSNIPVQATLVPRTTTTPMPDAKPTPTPIIIEISEQDWCMVQPTPMPVDPESDLGVQAIDPWTMVQPTPMPAEFAAGSAFVFENGTLFTTGELDRIQHIQAERDAGYVRHSVESDMVVLVPYGVRQKTENAWLVSKADGSGMQAQSAAITLLGDMALCQVNPMDYDGETWYLMLPARELTENDLLAVFDAFDLIGLTFDPSQISIRNCCRGLGYNRALQADETMRAETLSQLVYNDLIPSEIDMGGNRNLVLCCKNGSVFFLRPYSSMRDEELVQEVNINSRPVIEKIIEREARELLNKYFDFPLSMACNGYTFGNGSLPVQGITTDEHRLVLKQSDSIAGVSFDLSQDSDSYSYVDVYFDDVLEGRVLSVVYTNMPRYEGEMDDPSIYRLKTDEKSPELLTVAEQFAGRYFSKFALDRWYQATGDQLIHIFSAVPVKPYMILYTYTDDALFMLTIEEDGTLREAAVYFFDRSVDLAKEMAEHPDDYGFGDVLAEMSNE